jgi:hypothetical protein
MAAQGRPDGLTIRRLGEPDRAALAGLAERGSGPALEGPLLGAEIEGRLLAAISLMNGESLADPSSRATELRALLELRAAQLRRRQGRARRRELRLRRARGPRNVVSAARGGPW